jgi:outer membrane scaffolding protein for murein synthesis (MipA/OmpV family)
MKKLIDKHGVLLALFVGIAVLGLASTVALAEETARGDLGPGMSQTLVAGVLPDYEGVDTVDVGEKPQERVTWDVGLGVGAVPDYEGSEDYVGVPLLFARATCPTGRYVEFLANRLEANILANDMWSFGPMIRYRVKRDDDVDNDQVALMREVDESIEAGAFLGVKVDRWSAKIRLGQDIADGHDGFVLRFSVGYTIPVDQTLRYGLKVFTTYADEDYMDAYFDVDANNSARSGLAVFDADGGFKDVGGVFTVRYSPWEKWGIMGALGYSRLLGDAKDSPVVDDVGEANQYFGGVMATYRF